MARMRWKRLANKLLKALIVVTPIFTFCVVFLTILFGIANIENSQAHTRKIPHRTAPGKQKAVAVESLEIKAERTGLCDLLNSTDIRIISLPDGTSIHVNDTIVTMCNELRHRIQTYFGPRETKVNPFNHKFLVTAETTCSQNTDLVVLIHSLHTYYERRKAIRETWGGAIKRLQWPGDIPLYADDIKLVFVLGIHKDANTERALAEESTVYGDIVQGDFYEDYHNMTLKSLLGLKWVSEHCNSVKHVVKSDDDMIINFPYLTKVLTGIDMKWSIMGPLNKGSKVYRSGKWSIPFQKYPFHFYPPYESGSAYIISRDLVKPLLDLSEFVEHIFIDDVYITGILGKILKVNHITHPGFAFWTSKRPKACDIATNKILTGTKMKPKDLWKLWVELNKNPLEKC